MADAFWFVNYNPMLRVAGIGMAVAAGLLIGAVACWYELSRAGAIALFVLSLLTTGGTMTATVLMVVETYTDGKRPPAQPKFLQYLRSANAARRPDEVRHWQP